MLVWGSLTQNLVIHAGVWISEIWVPQQLFFSLMHTGQTPHTLPHVCMGESPKLSDPPLTKFAKSMVGVFLSLSLTVSEHMTRRAKEAVGAEETPYAGWSVTRLRSAAHVTLNMPGLSLGIGPKGGLGEHGDAVSLQLILIKASLLGRRLDNYEVVIVRPLSSVCSLVRFAEEPQMFAVEFSDGCPVHVGDAALSILHSMVAAHSDLDDAGEIVTLTLRVKRILSSTRCLPHIAQESGNFRNQAISGIRSPFLTPFSSYSLVDLPMRLLSLSDMRLLSLARTAIGPSRRAALGESPNPSFEVCSKLASLTSPFSRAHTMSGSLGNNSNYKFKNAISHFQQAVVSGASLSFAGNNFMAELVRCKHYEQAVAVYRKMVETDSVISFISCSGLLECFVLVGKTDFAYGVLGMMLKRGLNGECDKALSLLRKMRQNSLMPNADSYNTAIKSFCDAKKMEKALCIAEEMAQKKLSSLLISRVRKLTMAAVIDDAEDTNFLGFLKSVISSSVDEQDLGGVPSRDGVSASLNEKSSLKDILLGITSFPTKNPCDDISSRSKKMSREKNVHKVTQSRRFQKLFKSLAVTVGPNAVFQTVCTIGQQMSVREYDGMIRLHLEQAVNTKNIEDVLANIEKVFELLKAMRERGFKIVEGTYGPLFNYLIDMDMVEEFHNFKELVMEISPETVERLGFYEMLLWIQIGDEEKIDKLCGTIDGGELSIIQENYLLALCEKDQKDHVQKLIEIVDVTKVHSSALLTSIFGYLGRLSLESVANKLLCELRESGKDEALKSVSDLISVYSTCTPSTKVEDAVLKFNKMHEELDCIPSCTSYVKLVKYCCDSNEVVTTLDVVEKMCEEGVIVSAETLQSLLSAIEQTLEFDLVRRIYSIMCTKSIDPNSVNFHYIISLCIKVKDFKGAWNMLDNLKNFNLLPDSHMYNFIVGGYFREKKLSSAFKTVKEMKKAGIKPDSITYGYLIKNSNREKDITEYYEEMKQAGVLPTTRFYKSLIEGYVSCGQFEKAKQVLVCPDIPLKYRHELKNTLISSLAFRGNIADALSIYKEMKKESECIVERKTIISLIENCDSNVEVSALVQLADELHDHRYWLDGFFRIVVFAVRYRESSTVLDLLKQTKFPLSKDDANLEYHFDTVFWTVAELEPTNVKLGMDLLRFIKELGLVPTRKCLDFLLQACVNAKDMHNGLLVWKEYQSAPFPCNIQSYLRMHQVLLVGGDSKAAKALLSKIRTDDEDVQKIIEQNQLTFSQTPIKKKPA